MMKKIRWRRSRVVIMKKTMKIMMKRRHGMVIVKMMNKEVT